MEKNKSDIGHNSNLLLEDALKETVSDAIKSSRKAGDLALNMWIKLSNLFNKESELTKDEQNWNFKADKFNDLIMKNDPNPATNKKRLRKKYKPRKLTQKEVYDLYKEMDAEFQELFELSGDAAAYFRGSEHPLIKEIVKECDDDK